MAVYKRGKNLVVQVQLERRNNPGEHKANQQADCRTDGGYPQNLFGKR